MPSTKWKPIEDLPDNWRDLANRELETLPQAWANTSARLGDSAAMDEFNERLKREWAIETGVIENAYRIDRGTAETLIQHGIKASLIPHDASNLPAEQLVDIISAQQDALEGVFSFVKQERNLGTSFIKELHSALLREVDTYFVKGPTGRMEPRELKKGVWKTLPNNPSRPDGEIHEYCPPEHVAAEVDRLVAMHRSHQQVPPEIESAWLHHRFTQIHPFQDGNGRVARALASIVSIRAGWFPLLIRRQDIADYIEALEVSCIGDLGHLVHLFAHRHIDTFHVAANMAERVLAERAAYTRVRDVLSPRLTVRTGTYDILTLAVHLQERAKDRLRELRDRLGDIAVDTDSGFNSELRTANPDQYANFSHNVQVASSAVAYALDPIRYRMAVSLLVRSRSVACFLVVFASAERSLGDKIAAVAWLESSANDNQLRPITEADVLSREAFTFGAGENELAITVQFSMWMDNVITRGLERYADVLEAATGSAAKE